MYKTITGLAFAVLMLFSVGAEAQKFGHINSNELLAVMPATKKADSILMDYGKNLEAQLQGMTEEYQRKVNEYKQTEASMTQLVKETKVKEIGDLEKRIAEFQETAQQSIQKKKEETYTPIIKKAEEAIQNVAKEGSYTYIFDSSLGVLLFANDSDDVMPLVKKKLGL